MCLFSGSPGTSGGVGELLPAPPSPAGANKLSKEGFHSNNLEIPPILYFIREVRGQRTNAHNSSTGTASPLENRYQRERERERDVFYFFSSSKNDLPFAPFRLKKLCQVFIHWSTSRAS